MSWASDVASWQQEHNTEPSSLLIACSDGPGYYLYHLDYDVFLQGDRIDDEIETLIAPQTPHLLTHAKVYSVGEKYLIGGLKALALQKFEAAAKKPGKTNDLLNAAREAYTFTIETDRGLRDAVIAAFYAHSDLLKQEEVQDLFRDLNMLAFDLLMYVKGKYGILGRAPVY